MITEFEQVNFMKNWNNKLSCDSFTTFRLHNPRKYAIGRCLSIMLNRRRLKDANVVKIKTMKLNQVNEFVARLDMGVDTETFKQEIVKMYENKVDVWAADWDLILLESVTDKKAKPVQTTLNL